MSTSGRKNERRKASESFHLNCIDHAIWQNLYGKANNRVIICSEMHIIKVWIFRIKRILISLFALIIFQKSLSQPCDCLENLNALEKRISENYIGVRTKITADNAVQFAAFTDSLKRKAMHANEFACFKILKSWLDFTIKLAKTRGK